MMEQVNFGISLKNIPIPDHKSYILQLTNSIDKVIDKMRKKAVAFLFPYNNAPKETFGFTTTMSTSRVV